MFEPGRKEALSRYLQRLNAYMTSSNYTGVKAFVGIPLGRKIMANNYENIVVFKYNNNADGTVNGSIWYEMLQYCTTPYILVVRRQNAFHFEWANLEMSIRLIGDAGIAAVRGAIQNTTG